MPTTATAAGEPPKRGKPTIPKPAPAQLLALAVACRPDWNEDDTQAAIVGATIAGWSWTRIAASLMVLINDPKANPRHLIPKPRTVARPSSPDRIRAILDEEWPNGSARREPNK